MSTATFTSSSQLRASLAHLGQVAQGFAKALFAAQERQYAVPDVARHWVHDHKDLIALARSYQDMQPALAAELRNLAGRD
jgi:hypothetical protein